MSLPRLLVPAFLAALVSTAFAQKASLAPTADFDVANIFSQPDELWAVRSFGPGFVSPGVPILSTPVDFLRGLAFDGPDSGYFVSGYSEIGGPTGFYRFQ